MVTQTEPVHPSDAELLATMSVEPGDDVTATESHVRGCARCGAYLQGVANESAAIHALLGELDDPLPVAVEPRFARPQYQRSTGRGLRIAGAAALLAVAAAAIALPASPAHRWVFGDAPILPRPAAGDAGSGAAVTSGIAIPASQALVIVLRNEQRHGSVEITRTGAGDVTFRSRGGNTAYRVASDQVSIDNEVPADVYEIAIPWTVQHLRLLVGTRVLLRWPEDSAQRAPAPPADHLRIPLDSSTAHVQ
jgi:hypothetical protein